MRCSTASKQRAFEIGSCGQRYRRRYGQMYRRWYSRSRDRGTDGRTDRSTDSGTDGGTYRVADRGTTGVQTEVQPEDRQRYRNGAIEITSCKFLQDKTGLMVDHQI